MNDNVHSIWTRDWKNETFPAKRNLTKYVRKKWEKKTMINNIAYFHIPRYIVNYIATLFRLRNRVIAVAFLQKDQTDLLIFIRIKYDLDNVRTTIE